MEHLPCMLRGRERGWRSLGYKEYLPARFGRLREALQLELYVVLGELTNQILSCCGYPCE